MKPKRRKKRVTKKVPGDAEIQRYNLKERLIHWTVATSFLYLLLSGLALYSPRLYWISSLLGGGTNIRIWHPYAGVVFFLAVTIMTVNWRRCLWLYPEDWEWIRYTWSYITHGEEGVPESKVSREHRVVMEGPEGRFLSVTGAKLTCFRSLAEEVGDLVMARLGRSQPSRSAALTLDGSDEEAATLEARVSMDVSEEMAASGLSRETLEVLVETYGRGYGRVIELARKLPDGTERLCPRNPEIVAQLHQAVREEMAVSLQDVLLRRTGIGLSLCQGLDCSEAIGSRMAELCGWSPRRLDAELAAYRQHVDRSHRFRTQ